MTRRVPPHLYIHVPYCLSKCPYCDFYSESADGLPSPERYVARVAAELDETEGDFETVFVGGGTPSALAESALGRLCDAVRRRLADGGEWTVEANPADLTPALAETLVASGVNRLSLGVQSASDAALDALGRRHRHAESVRAVASARAAGFRNLGGDMIFGLPGDAIEETIGFFVESGMTHVSAYELTIEGRSAWKRAGVDPSVSDEEKVTRLERVVALLAEAGFRRYEISNFARPGFECRSHLNVWHSGSYVGLGAGAHGFESGIRYRHPDSVEGYLAGEPVVEEPVENLAAETMMLGMRMPEGIELPLLPVERRAALVAAHAKLEALAGDGLITLEEARIRPTPRGLLFVNEIAARMIDGGSS